MRALILLCACVLLVACGSTQEQLRAASGGASFTPTPAATATVAPTAGHPTGSPAAGTTRISDDLGGWAMDVPSDWRTRPAPQHGYEIRNYDPAVPLPSNTSSEFLPPQGGVVVSVHMQQNPDRQTPAAFYQPVNGPGLDIREHRSVTMGGRPAEFWSVWQSQPSDFQRLEPRLSWYVASPFFDDRMMVITAAPGESAQRAVVERMVETLQFYQPAPPPSIALVTRAQAIENAIGGVQKNVGASITRVEAKLVFYKEWERTQGSRSYVEDPDMLVWVVTYEGIGLYCGRGGPHGTPPPCHFAFSVQPARPPEMVGVFGVTPTWPAWFGALVDRDR